MVGGLIVLAGCSTSRIAYPYLAATDNCHCLDFHVHDGKIDYLFHASYRMDDGVLTTVDITFTNRSSRDTLFTGLGSVKVSSRNITYQYNDRFLPLPILTINPRSSNIVHLSGRDISGEDDWHKIAGEQLTVTIKGVRLGDATLRPQEVDFIPENPKLGK